MEYDRVPMSAQLTSISPQFLVDDLDAAVSYYREKLGFTLEFTYESFYASVSRDGLSIHLKHAPKTAEDRAHRRRERAPGRVSRCEGHPRASRRAPGAGARITKPIGERPWGFVDFYVEDADGYILCFSEGVE